MDSTELELCIRRILTAPGIDLATISSKKVRKELAGTFGEQSIKQNKEVRKQQGWLCVA